MSDAKDEERARASWDRNGFSGEVWVTFGPSLAAAFAAVREEGRRETLTCGHHVSSRLPDDDCATCHNLHTIEAHDADLAALRRVADAARAVTATVPAHDSQHAKASRTALACQALRDALAALDAAGGGE